MRKSRRMESPRSSLVNVLKESAPRCAGLRRRARLRFRLQGRGESRGAQAAPGAVNQRAPVMRTPAGFATRFDVGVDADACGQCEPEVPAVALAHDVEVAEDVARARKASGAFRALGRDDRGE